jgi:hypothetical protein
MRLVDFAPAQEFHGAPLYETNALLSADARGDLLRSFSKASLISVCIACLAQLHRLVSIDVPQPSGY